MAIENPQQVLEPETLPKGWRRVQLKEVCELNPRRINYSNRSDDAPTTFVQMSAVNDVKGIIERPEIKTYSEVKKGYTFFTEGDVLFAKITPCMQNGKHAIAHNLIDGIGFGSTEFHVLRPTESVSSEWIHFFVRQPSVLKEAMAHFTGAVGQQRVPESFLASLEISLPPLSEQKRIAATLNERMAAVERARAAAEAQLKAAKDLPAAYLRDVFDSTEAKGWSVKPFGELVNNFDGMRIPVKLEDRHGRKGQYPYYGASGVIDYVDEYLFDGEFLLIGEDGANLIMRSSPIAFRATGKFWVNNHAHVVKPKDEISLDYLLHFFAITNLESYVTGTAQPKLTQKDLNRVPVPVPPQPEMTQIVKTLNSKIGNAEELTKALKDQLDSINKLPAALLRQAFTGKL
jgi:type I restriction enzyme S subunit